MNAVQLDQYECVRVLVESGLCNVNARSTKQDMTPLGILSLSPHDHVLMMVHLLVNHGARLTELQQQDKYNLLHLASSVGNLSLVQYLLAQQVFNVDSYCAYGYTPLHYSIMMRPFEYFKKDRKDMMENFVQVGKYLLLSGADARKKTRDGLWDAMSLSLKYSRVLFMSELLPIYYPRISKLLNSKNNSSNKTDDAVHEKMEIRGLSYSPSSLLLKNATKIIVEYSQRELNQNNSPISEQEAKGHYYLLEKMNSETTQWNEKMFRNIISLRGLVLQMIQNFSQKIFSNNLEKKETEQKKIKISHAIILQEIDELMTEIQDANSELYSYLLKILSEQIGYFHQTEYPTDSQGKDIECNLEKITKSSLQQKKNLKKKKLNKKQQIGKELLQRKMQKLIIPDKNLFFIIESKSIDQFFELVKNFWENVQILEYFAHDLEKKNFSIDRRILRLFIELLLLREGSIYK